MSMNNSGMSINDLRARLQKKSTNVTVDNQKILDTVTGGSQSNFKERVENELKLSLKKGQTSASVKVRILPSPVLFGYLRESEGNRFEGMTTVPYYESKSHWLGNKDAKKFYITKCSNTGWDDESCPACNLKKKAILNYKTNTAYHKFIKSEANGGLFNVNPTSGFLINVHVLEDKQNPDNVGKVMFYNASSGLFNKVILPMIKGDPEAGIDGIDVTNVLTGRDFYISVKEGPQYPDYIEGSRFMDASPFMPFFERKDKNGPNNRSNLVTVPYNSVEEFEELAGNPDYLVDDTLVDMNTGEPLLPVVYKLNKRYLDMLINGLEVNGTNLLPLENLAKMIDPAFDSNSFTGEEAVGKFTEFMGSYGYDIYGDPLKNTQEDSFGSFDEPVVTKEQTAQVDGIVKHDLSSETVTKQEPEVQKVSSETVEIKKGDDATPVSEYDFADYF